jgi:hypothetical protein
MVLALGPVAVSAQTEDQEDEADAFASFTLRADASGVMGNFRRQGEDPTGAGIVPYTQSSLGTGPVGYALASVAWPGPIFANGGSLLGLVLPTCAPPPGPSDLCSPPAPPQATLLNEPVRAEAYSPLGPHDSQLSPAMTAHAKDSRSEASAGPDAFSVPGVLEVEDVHTTSRTYVEGGKAVAEARTVLSGVHLADDAVTIDKVTTVAIASTDGVTATADSDTIVEGLKVGEQDATVDEHGVTFAGNTSPNPVDAVAQQINEQVLSHMGAELFVTRPVEPAPDGGAARSSSGSLVFVWEIPESGKYGLIVSLGGASVQVRARPADGIPEDDFDEDDFFVEDEEPLDELVPDDTFGGGDLGGDEPAPTTGGGSPAPVIEPEPVAATGTFGGVAPGLLAVSLVGSAMTGVGLRRVFASVLAPPPSPCPLGQGT